VTRPLVVFGEDWGRFPSSTQHIIGRLARDRDVIWVNSLGLRRPRLSAADLRRAAAKIGSLFAARATATSPDRPPRLTIVNPASLSFPASATVQAFNRLTLSRQIGQALTRRGLSRPIVWTSLPSALPVLGQLGERAVVYYCGDDFGALAGVDHAPVAAMERAVVEGADLVLAASEILANRFPADKTRLVEHGVDIDLFGGPAARPADLPSGKPIAGFYGSLSSWIDFDLIARSARLLPDWWFVLIGPARTDLAPLAGLPNVRLLGPRPHGALAGYVRHWDVSLLPFRDCPQIRACNPLKLREYMAAGRPIVSTPFPALEPYRQWIEVGSDAEAYAAAIRRAAGDRRRCVDRQAIVRNESWDERAAQVDLLLNRFDD
jgi:glycosyltransferase involved in cell wall biosynthesis